ncbi:RNA recognition motif-containing protein RRM [Reticulomyxa filosa]|uniref:RNA recognition motif-containing protein RRM n=1 Tax=Reticulomyxa filosa TaxID=46433 RepID=X6NB35_RETFI|nr:RNA recognition motif-containing protein RRM [Reticulomyxa filosa]|eukprot:ETO22527.1 RNA recognition motif-containing protein RRM [Reticulomyxa filosa]
MQTLQSTPRQDSSARLSIPGASSSDAQTGLAVHGKAHTKNLSTLSILHLFPDLLNQIGDFHDVDEAENSNNANANNNINKTDNSDHSNNNNNNNNNDNSNGQSFMDSEHGKVNEGLSSNEDGKDKDKPQQQQLQQQQQQQQQQQLQQQQNNNETKPDKKIVLSDEHLYFDALSNDVWSFGVILLLVFGECAFLWMKPDGDKDPNYPYIMANLEDELRSVFHLPKKLSHSKSKKKKKKLLLMIFVPQDIRPTIKEIVEHPFFQNVCNNNDDNLPFSTPQLEMKTRPSKEDIH